MPSLTPQASRLSSRRIRIAQIAGVVRLELRSLAVFPLDRLINCLAMHGDVARGVDAQPHFVAADIDNRDDNVVADNDAFVTVSGQNQHRWLLPDNRAAAGE